MSKQERMRSRIANASPEDRPKRLAEYQDMFGKSSNVPRGNGIDMGFIRIDNEIPLYEWCAKHGLKPLEAECIDCGTVLKTDVPFRGAGKYGLRSDACPTCDNPDVPFVLKSDEWDKQLGVRALNCKSSGPVLRLVKDDE